MASSAKELIKNRQLIEDRKETKVEITVPNVGTFLFRLPTIEDYNDSEAKGKNRPGEGVENKYLILSCCVEPDLRDKELLEAYECKEPIDIVDKLFMIGDIHNIATELVNQAGFDKDYLKVVTKAKN